MPQPSEKRHKRKIRTRETRPNKKVRLSTDLDSRVKDISFGLIVMSSFGIFFGSSFFLVFLATMFSPTSQTIIATDNPPFWEMLVISLVLLCISFFILKFAFDFRAYKKWTFEWLPLLSFIRGFHNLRKIFYDPNFRKAFDQPEFEYPEHPEYGYKLEDEIKNKRT